MSEPERPLPTEPQVAALFRALAEAQAQKRHVFDKKAAWDRIESRQAAKLRARTPWSIAWRALPALAAAAITVLAIHWWSPAALHYALTGGSVEAGMIHASRGKASLAFSDGSFIGAEPQSVLSVSVVGAHAAMTRLERGKLDIRVRHTDSTDWRFFAGPYEVQVVGTQLELGWEPESRSIEVTMREGQVRLSGPSGLNRVLGAGAHYRVSLGDVLAANSAVNAPPAKRADATPELAAAPLAPPAASNEHGAHRSIGLRTGASRTAPAALAG